MKNEPHRTVGNDSSDRVNHISDDIVDVNIKAIHNPFACKIPTYDCYFKMVVISAVIWFITVCSFILVLYSH